MPNPAEVDLSIENQVARITIGDEKGMNLMNTPTMERIIRLGEKLKSNVPINSKPSTTRDRNALLALTVMR